MTMDNFGTPVSGKDPNGNERVIEVDADGKVKTAVHFNPLLGTDHTASGLKFTDTAGEALVFGDVCYLKSDGKYWKADADAAGTMPVVAMALATIAGDADGVFLHMGFVRDDSWAWTIGGLIYASTTAGELTQTAPSGSGDVVQRAGYALTATIVCFMPDITTDADLIAHIADFQLHTDGKRTTSDHTINNSDTVENIPDLLFAVEANSVYTFYLLVKAHTKAASDLKYTVVAPSGATIQWYNLAQPTTLVPWRSAGAVINLLASVDRNPAVLMMMGIVTVGATAGNVQFQAAQNTAVSEDLKILAGSCIVPHKIP